MDKNKRFCVYFIHIYVLCTLLGLLLFPIQGVSRLLLAIGANSIYIALGVALSATLPTPWAIGALLWSVVLLTALLVTYFISIKRHYLPLLIVSILDVIPVMIFSFYTFTEKNMYGFWFAMFDIVVSIVVVSLFSICFLMRKKKGQGGSSVAPLATP